MVYRYPSPRTTTSTINTHCETIEVYILGSEYLHYLENTTYTHIKTIVFKMRIDCRCSSFRARVPVHSKCGCNCNLS